MEQSCIDEGRGPVILIVHGGMGDGTSWHSVAKRLTRRFRVVRIHRRRYRLDIASDAAVTVETEVRDLLALVAGIGEPVVLVGHSTGAVIALEAAAMAPESFVALVAYEPPLVINEPLGGAAIAAARVAVDAGRPGRAIALFERNVFGAGRLATLLFRTVVSLVPELRAFVPRQIDDVQAMDDLGNRLATYATIRLPTLMLSGARSPVNLRERCCPTPGPSPWTGRPTTPTISLRGSWLG